MHCSFFASDIHAHKIFYVPLQNSLPRHLLLFSSIIIVVWTALPLHFTILLLCTTHCVVTSFQYFLMLQKKWAGYSAIPSYTINGIGSYNPPNNFCVLSLDKTDHVVQNRTMVIRRYTRSDLISVVWFYFDGRTTKKRANAHAKLWIGQESQKNFLQKPVTDKQKAGWQFRIEKHEKNPQNMQERPTSIWLEKLFGGL